MSAARGLSLRRLLVLVVISAIALQLYFLIRIVCMVVIDPQSTTFQRSEAWRLLREPRPLRWRQQWLDYPALSPTLKRAVIASEDSGFTEHSGVEWDALEKAWAKNERAALEDAGRDRHRRARDAARAGVDDDVERLAAVVERGRRDARRNDAAERLDVARDELAGARDGAVGNDHLARAARDQRPERAGGAAAGADHEHARAGECDAGVALDVAHEPGAVGVVAVPAVGIEAQHVARAGEAGARAVAVGERPGVELERHRHVAAAAAAGNEAAHRRCERVERAEQPVVDDGFASLRSERRVDERRLAVCDGIAADDVAALGRGHHRPVSVVSRPSSREKRKREGIASWSACRFIAVVKRPYGAAA